MIRQLTFDARAGEQAIGLRYLCRFVKAVLSTPKVIVEIGSYCGASSAIIAKSFPEATLHCVDPWEKYTEDCSTYDLERQALELKESELLFDEVAAAHPNIVKHKQPSLYASKFLGTSLDFIYIDGNHQHSSVIQDLGCWFPKVRLGGAVCGHDYSWPSVSYALKSFFRMTPDAVFCDGSWIYFVSPNLRKLPTIIPPSTIPAAPSPSSPPEHSS